VTCSLARVNEILPGVLHWTAFRETIGQPVQSYYLVEARALVDPMLPEGGVEAFADRPAPERILLTNRHHYRASDPLREAFGCPVLCHEAGLHEFEGGPDVDGFSFGDEVAPGVIAREVAAICPEETALHAAGPGAMCFADGLIRYGGELGFVPDDLLGDDPEEVKRGLRAAFRGLLQHDFDRLLVAHGDPLVGGGKAALAAFAEENRPQK
jgi:hypothetical protein